MLETLLTQIRLRVRKMASQYSSNANRSRYDTSDIAQEALFQIWREYSNSDPAANHEVDSDHEATQPLDGDGEAEPELESVNKSWLKRLAKGHAAKLHRFHTAQRRSVKQQVNIEPFRDASITCSDSELPPNQQIEQREQVLLLIDALDQLLPFERHVVCQHFFQGHSVAGIARDSRKSTDVVRRTKNSALAKLRRALAMT